MPEVHRFGKIASLAWQTPSEISGTEKKVVAAQ
jgi:hypothetical protein